MKILFITFSDIRVCSSSNIRNVSLIKGLLDIGHTVDIISYQNTNKAVLIDESFTPIISKCKIIEIKAKLSAEKISSGLLSSDEKSIKRRIYARLRKLYYSLETVDAMRKVASEIDISNLELQEYDLMISSSNPYSVHIFAERIKDRFFTGTTGTIRWIQYWGDALYLDTLTRRPLMPFRVKEAERKLICNCDKVVYTNGVVLDLQRKLFPEHAKKMVFIETPFAFRTEEAKDYKYQIGYFGSYSSTVRDIIPLYQALKDLEIESIIVGNGDQQIESTDKIDILPRASVNEIADYEAQTRILVCVCNKLSEKGETGLIPGKAYHYGATSKEVLVVGASPDVRKFLERYNRYIFVDNEVEEIKQVLKKTIKNDKQIYNPLLETQPGVAAGKFLEDPNI